MEFYNGHGNRKFGCIVLHRSFLPPHPKTAHSHARALIGTAGEQLQIACGSNGVNSEGTRILLQYLV